VALRLIEAEHFRSGDELARFDERQRVAAALHHRSLVPYYEAGEWNGGRFVATRLVRGRTLADLCAAGSAPPPERLGPVADALRAAHSAGLAHGRVSAANILVEPGGEAYLADLGLSGEGSAADDDRALAELTELLAERATRTRRRRRRRALGAAMAAGVVAVVAVATAGGGEEPERAVPRAATGTTSVGNDLAAEPDRPLGCSDKPTLNTAACTIAPAPRGSGSATVRRAGVIRSWALRGASGHLALQVIRTRGGRSFVAGFSQPESVDGAAPRSFKAEIAVRAGDRIGVRLAPGAVIGASDTPGARLERWDGALTADSQAGPGDAIDGELMLRADIEPGGRAEGPPQLRGPAAASAPAGRRLIDTPVVLRAGRGARAVAVELPEEIAVDVVRGRRLARISVPDADPDGELLGLEPSCGPAGAHGFCLHWRNPGEPLTLLHAYRVRRDGSLEQIG
jgi:hypothetical protein